MVSSARSWVVFCISVAACCLALAGRTHAQGSCANYAKAAPAIGLYFPARGTFYLQDSDGSSAIKEVVFANAEPDWIPIAGKWQAGGFDSIGLYDPETSTFHLKYETTSGPPDVSIWYGSGGGGWYPIAGDWSNKGYSSIGLYNRNSGAFYLKNSNTGGAADIVLPFGALGDQGQPIVGDWVGDGVSRVGLFQPATSVFQLRLSNSAGNTSNRSFQFGGGPSAYRAIAGQLQPGSSAFGVALYRGSVFIERYALEGGAGDNTEYFAPQGMQGGVLPQAVIGRWKPSKCLGAGQNTSSPIAPSWVKDLVVYEMRFETFSEGAPPGGYIQAATALLPQLQDLGINAVSLNPIAEGPSTGDVRTRNLYGASKPDKIDPQLGSSADFANFVSQAHARGIKVFVDNVVHGLVTNSPYVTGPNALPADFFSHEANGAVASTYYNTAALDWTSRGLRDWWVNNIGLGWVNSFQIDGFRMDLEPAIAGTGVWSELRFAVLAVTGKQIALIPETSPAKRAYTFDIGQGDTGIGGDLDFHAGSANVVDTIKASTETYYANQISSHDSATYEARGRLSAFAYGSVLSPYIPRFFMGEEWNATPDLVIPGGVLYFSQLHWAQKSANRAFYDKVKKLIAIRKQYANIFSTGTSPLNTAKIVKAPMSGVDLEPYAMWNGNTSITVVAKRDTPSGNVTVKIPVDAMAMSQYPWFRVTDLLAGTQSFHSYAQIKAGFARAVARGDVLVLKAEGLPGAPDVRGFIDSRTANANGSYTVGGWICAQYADVSLVVHLYLGNLNGTGKHFSVGGTANLPSEPAVASVCEAQGTRYRFQLTIPAADVATSHGQTIFVHGLSPFGLNNYAITQPRDYQLP